MRPTHHPYVRCRAAPPPLFLLAALLAVSGCHGNGVAEGALPSGTGPSSAGAPATGQQSDEVLATVDGEPVTMADVAEVVGGRLGEIEFQYRSQRHQLIEAVMKQLVRDRLIEDQASQRGITADQLVEEVLADKGQVTDEEISFFYQQNRAQLGGRPLEQVYPQIRTHLEDQQRQSIVEEFAQRLAAERDVTYVLGPFRVDLEIAGAPVKGPEDAAVTLVEFSDFECPYCRQFFSTLEQVEESYGDQIRIAYRQFPLDIHPNAAKAAEASLCADDQGKFWEAHDLYFIEQASLTVADLKEKAGRLGLDAIVFDACLDSGKYAEQVEADTRLGMSVGVSGTPALFINGRPLPGGAVPYEMVAEIIDDELDRSRR